MTDRSEIKTTLLAVVGVSPAIVTETVWALANPRDGGTPVIPSEVVLVTTRRGKSDIENSLFQPLPEWDGLTVWQALRRVLLGTAAEEDSRLKVEPIRVITANDPKTGRARELDDIRSAEENSAAARVILDEVRRVTSNDDLRLIASLAGGRKTMGALLHAAVSLLGRRKDRLTHILVNPPFEDPRLQPRFYFPGQPGGDHRLLQPDGSELAVKNTDAVLELAAVPFAALHELFRQRLGRLPGEWDDLVKSAAGIVEELNEPIRIELDESSKKREWTATINGIPVKLSGRDIPFFCFLLQRARNGESPYPLHQDAIDDFLDFLVEWMPKHLTVNLQYGESDWRDSKHWPTADHLRKRVDSLRTRLSKAGLGGLIPDLFPVRGGLGFDPSKVRIEE